ncbi:MAG: hypothetical protein IPG82_19515 [Saprospiraceae bacterium]|nr:hypothetical protein [Saprospiraceae bacterium]
MNYTQYIVKSPLRSTQGGGMGVTNATLFDKRSCHHENAAMRIDMINAS